MSAGWVAGTVRGRSIAARRLGPDGETMLAATADLASALDYLDHTGYGHHLQSGLGLEDAQHAIGSTALWHLRVLAGWLPPRGGEVIRIIGGWFEAHNLVDHALHLGAGTAIGPRYDLGALATVWPSARAAGSLDALATVLRANGWGHPDVGDLDAVLHAIGAGWGRRLADGATERPAWGEALVAIELAKNLLVEPGRPVGWRDRLTSRVAADVCSIDEMVRGLPDDATWVLDGVDDVRDAVPRWWERVAHDADRGLAGTSMDRDAVTCAGMALVVDAHRVQGMLAQAWRRGGSGGAHADA